MNIYHYAIFSNLYYYLNGSLLNIYSKILAQYPAIPRGARFNHVSSHLLMNASYTKSGRASPLVKLKDLELVFFSLLDGLSGSASTVFLLGLKY